VETLSFPQTASSLRDSTDRHSRHCGRLCLGSQCLETVDHSVHDPHRVSHDDRIALEKRRYSDGYQGVTRDTNREFCHHSVHWVWRESAFLSPAPIFGTGLLTGRSSPHEWRDDDFMDRIGPRKHSGGRQDDGHWTPIRDPLCATVPKGADGENRRDPIFAGRTSHPTDCVSSIAPWATDTRSCP